MSRLVEDLAEIVGPDHIAADRASLERYAQDESPAPRLMPWAVVRPGCAEEVQQVVAWANETATPLVPVSSGGPHFYGDTVPSVPGAVMFDLSRMNRILRIDRRNRMAVIEPGVTYPQLQAALAENGMRVTPPLYPRANKSVVASLLERQPTLIPRYNFQLPEPLRSCGVVWGNGDVMFTGEAGAGPLSLQAQWDAGLVQADAKGPGQTDFFRLLTGAQGTMGIVTWASVRCELLPSAHTLLFASAWQFDRLTSFVQGLAKQRLADELLVFDAVYLARLIEAIGLHAVARDLPPWTVLVGLGGREHLAEERVQVALADASRLAGSCGVGLETSLGGVAASLLGDVLGGCCTTPWKLAAKGSCVDVFFLTTLDKVAGFVDAGRELVESLGLTPSDLGVYIQPQHQGTVHHVELSLPFDSSATTERALALRFSKLAAERLIDAGAYFSRPYGVWAPAVYRRDATARAVLRKVKVIFDPAGIMNPGKLCFSGPTLPAPVGKEA